MCDKDNHRIQIFKSNNFVSFGEQGSEPGNFNQPVDLTVNNSEDQLITDCYYHRVKVFTPQGQFLRLFKFYTDFHFTLHCPVGKDFKLDNT